MPPVVAGRCRIQFALPLLAAITFASLGRAAPPEPVTLKEHTGWVGAVAFSHDGKTLATASADNTVKLWDTATWKTTATLKGHTDYVACVCFAPDGETLVSGSYDHTAIVWDLATGKPWRTLKGHKGAVLSVAMNPASGEVATGSIDGTVRTWNPENAGAIATSTHKLWVNAVAYSPNAAALASASSDFTVVVWNRQTKQPVHTFAPKAAEVRCLSFTPDGKYLAAGTRYGITKVWETEKGEEIASLKGKHGAEVWGVCFSPDGKVLATADGDWNRPSDIVLWEVPSARPEGLTHTWKERERLKHTNEVLCVAFHPKKPILAAGAWDKTVRVWDLTELLKDSK